MVVALVVIPSCWSRVLVPVVVVAVAVLTGSASTSIQWTVSHMNELNSSCKNK